MLARATTLASQAGCLSLLIGITFYIVYSAITLCVMHIVFLDSADSKYVCVSVDFLFCFCCACVRACVRACVCVCVYFCMLERERQRQRHSGQTETDNDTERHVKTVVVVFRFVYGFAVASLVFHFLSSKPLFVLQ